MHFVKKNNNDELPSPVLDEIYNNTNLPQTNDIEYKTINGCKKELQTLMQQVADNKHKDKNLSSHNLKTKYSNFRKQLAKIKSDAFEISVPDSNKLQKNDLLHILSIYDELLNILSNPDDSNIFKDCKTLLQNFMAKVADTEKEDNNLNTNQIFTKYQQFRKDFAKIRKIISNINVTDNNKLQKDELETILWQYDELLTTKLIGNDYNKLVNCQEAFEYCKQKLVPLLNQSKIELRNIKVNLLDLKTPDKQQQKQDLLSKVQQYEDMIIRQEAILASVDD